MSRDSWITPEPNLIPLNIGHPKNVKKSFCNQLMFKNYMLVSRIYLPKNPKNPRILSITCSQKCCSTYLAYPSSSIHPISSLLPSHWNPPWIQNLKLGGWVQGLLRGLFQNVLIFCPIFRQVWFNIHMYHHIFWQVCFNIHLYHHNVWHVSSILAAF